MKTKRTRTHFHLYFQCLSFFSSVQPQYSIQTFLKSKINSFENLAVNVNWEHFETSRNWIRVCLPINHYTGLWSWQEFEKNILLSKLLTGH